MRFSLVVGTIKRTVELDRLLGSLAKQSCQDFELIVVDQNPDNGSWIGSRPMKEDSPSFTSGVPLGFQGQETRAWQ
jgi:GT2 family glycosyltransferase